MPIDSVFSLFDSGTISTGMEKVAPGGVKMKLLPMPLEKRDAGEAARLFAILLSISGEVAIGLFTNWLFEKLRSSKRPSVKINRRMVESITKDGIQRVIEEEIESR